MAMTEEGRCRELEARVLSYHDVSFEKVLSEIAYLRDTGDSVIAGGSLAYSLGNRLSDLDLVITGPSTAHSSLVPLEHFIGSLRVDVWKLEQKLVEETFERAEDALAGEGLVLGSFGDVDREDELKLLHRIIYGITIDGPHLQLASTRNHRVVATNLVVREYGERMRSSALLAQLAIQADRPLAAVFNARLAVEAALNASVVERGLPFTGDKWLRERLAGQAADLATLHDPFRELPIDPDTAGADFVEEAIATCRRLWGLALQIEDVSRFARWSNPDLSMHEVGDECMLISAKHGVLIGVDLLEAEAWRGLSSDSGKTEPSVWGVDECGGSAATLSYQLYERGLLDLEWERGVPISELHSRKEAARDRH